MGFRCGSRFAPRLVWGIVFAALGLACGRHAPVEAIVRDSGLAAAGHFGVFLGATPAFAPAPAPPGRLLRPARTSGFEVGYRRIEIRRGTRRGGKLRGTLWAGPAAEGALHLRLPFGRPSAASPSDKCRRN